MATLQVVTGLRVVLGALVLPVVNGADWPVGLASCEERTQDDCCPTEGTGEVTLAPTPPPTPPG